MKDVDIVDEVRVQKRTFIGTVDNDTRSMGNGTPVTFDNKIVVERYDNYLTVEVKGMYHPAGLDDIIRTLQAIREKQLSIPFN